MAGGGDFMDFPSRRFTMKRLLVVFLSFVLVGLFSFASAESKESARPHMRKPWGSRKHTNGDIRSMRKSS